MAKYSEQFKLTVVQDYLSDASKGYRAIGRRHGLSSHSMVERWVNVYKLHGMVGLRKKFSQYNAEYKMSVLQYMWDNQLSVSRAAAHFDIRNSVLVSSWEREYHAGNAATLLPRQRGKPKLMMASDITRPEEAPDDQRSREELLAELQQLRMELAYTKKLHALVQARQTQAPQKKRK